MNLEIMSQRFHELHNLYYSTLKVLHDVNHPAVRALKIELDSETESCHKRNLYLKRFKCLHRGCQPIHTKELKFYPQMIVVYSWNYGKTIIGTNKPRRNK